MAGALIAVVVLAGLWVSGSISDRNWKPDVVSGKCVRTEIGSVELGLIPYWRDRHFANVPLDCDQDFSMETPGSIVISGLIINVALSGALIFLTVVGLQRAFRRRAGRAV